MIKLKKQILSCFIAATMLVSAIPVFANTVETYDATSNNIGTYNCHIFDTDYTIDSQKVYAVNSSATGSITSTTISKNYTPSSADLTATLQAVNAVGEKTPIATITKTIASGTEVAVALNSNISDIPVGTVKLITEIVPTTDNLIYSTGEIPVVDYDVESPVEAPADSPNTTFSAHDPSIVKYPNDDTYYVYSSHHLIFTSEDLINWTKYDFESTNTSVLAPKTYKFISANINSEVNDTYWAPDVIYVPEDTKTPYWMYISVSCGLGGRNSAIGLIKSPTPLFWADSDSEKVSAITDCGVVFATKETSSYKTNAIDANIYTDSNGQKYFIWGSFWQGIQGAKLKDDGFVEGIDYTSDSTILSSCANFGKTLYSQKSGTAGPEGPWTIEHGDYRYMFTSYGWLGSNYNTRVARSPLSTDLSTVLGTPTETDDSFKDENNVAVGNQYSSGSTSTPSGYKIIGSYRLGEGASNSVELSDSNYYIPYTNGDAHIYYGPGHNSAIQADDGDYYYVSHTRKDYVEGAAWLQTRKMLWTSDGWPVVSPVTYAGEKEQKLPVDLIYGTYDFASVGHTKKIGGSITARNFDVPVMSSKITLQSDGTLADGLGTWEYDNDHTVTITFTKDGDESKDEFYKANDVVTLFALLSYDRDEQRYVMALTGTDQNHITQFATKPMDSEVYTTPQTITTESTTIPKSVGGNPVLGFDANGNTMYGGDPAALVDGDTVYMYVGHDTSTNEGYNMPNWVCYSSKNMTDWKYESVVMNATDISWRNDNNSAWASQAVKYNNKYYLYFCTWDKTSSGKQSIGVAVSDSPTGPFIDIGKPLISGSFTVPESNSHDDIDPTVLIDTDSDGVEHRYLAWGNTRFYICELNEDMISVKDLDNDGKIIMHKDVKERKIKSMGNNVFTEAPWLYKRDGKYYMFFAANWREEMAYAMADDPMGRWDFKQKIMPPTATSNTNHPAVIDFNDKTYFIYHNGMLPHGSGFRRSVCIQELEFDENGYVYPLTELSIGLNGTANTIKTNSNKYIAHADTTNPLSDSSYPLNMTLQAKDSEDNYNTAWQIVSAKAVPSGENADNYVSIQSVNKAGLYISVQDGNVVLTQDADGNQGESMTFKTVKGINGEDTISFESVTLPNRFLTVVDNTIALSYGIDTDNSSFIIGDISPVEKNQISVATPETEPLPEPAVNNNFNNETAKTIMSIGTTDQGVNTNYAGVNLYIGTRDSGADNSTSWSIASGGVSGNALVMTSGKFVSSSRGPRMQLTTPTIPNGVTVTATIKAKLGDATNAKLYYGDSTGTQATTTLSGVSSTDWSEIKITIKNDNDLYFRTIYVNNTIITQDYVDVFPVLWGTSVNSTNAKVYFDDVSIQSDVPIEPLKAEVSRQRLSNNIVSFTLKNAGLYNTVTAFVAEYNSDNALVGIAKSNITLTSNNQKIEIPYTKKEGDSTFKLFVWHNTDDMIPATIPVDIVDSTNKEPELIAKYDFENNLTDSISKENGTLTGSLIQSAASVSEAKYVDGKTGKAINFTGDGSYGVSLPTQIADSAYTISFDTKLTATKQYSPFVFIINYDGTTLKGDDSNAQWVSIAPQGFKTELTDGPMIWSRNVPENALWNDILTEDNNSIKLNEWHNITVTANDAVGIIYVDGTQIATGPIADIIDSTTKIYLGVNAWDTPLNGVIDNLLIYDGALTTEKIAEIINK